MLLGEGPHRFEQRLPVGCRHLLRQMEPAIGWESRRLDERSQEGALPGAVGPGDPDPIAAQQLDVNLFENGVAARLQKRPGKGGQPGLWGPVHSR